ncbi:PREDICTED: ferric reduction oxidase 8, mitochondrial isoform X2 [Tarenaya hassleriana]|uniref:ferric reduction oxidase 8, mitochondrial isoform X2 n=1 Tax=Tarenaya hassleriana TaxID=28532 RepID=UPI00053C2F1E|nr:PREDICTED: ferric reduction oxidase 8, mitochondrial isoform X2 [Tarenaya hassleriana]
MAKGFTLVALRALMISIFLGWISLWILRPTNLWTRAWRQAEEAMKHTFFGYYGLNFVVLSFPVVAISMIGLIYLSFPPQNLRNRGNVEPQISVSNPIIISQFIGIVSCFELVALLLFLLLLAWTFYARISNDFKKLMPVKSMKLDLWQLKYLRVATRFGLLAEACLALLLLPVLRGLSVFRLWNIQFEASVKYHIWLGTAMIFFAMFHGGSILFIWLVSHHFEDEIWRWQRTGRIYLAGLIALVMGLLMWITSLPQIRRKKFEVFYYTHHLYIIFLVFFLFHAGDRHFYWVLPGIFLFGLDKVLRTVQSRTESYVLSASLFPCNAIELVIPKVPSLTYAPSSVIFMNVPSISRFEWHPFSITSSSILDRHTMSVMVKCEGGWTESLYNMVQATLGSGNDQKTNIRIRVEGPQGPALVDFLRYENMLLVAGGVGITPFLSILQEIACVSSKPGFRYPKRMQLLFVVKTCQDISMLIPISSILSKPIDVHLKLKVYVTREKHSTSTLRELLSRSVVQTVCFGPAGCSGFPVLGPESSRWLATLLGITVIAFIIALIGLSHVLIPAEKMKNVAGSMKLVASGGNKIAKEKSPSWVADLVIIASYFIALTIAGLLATIQHRRQRQRQRDTLNMSSAEEQKARDRNLIESTSAHVDEHEIHCGERPDFEEIFSEFRKESRTSNAGVLVCGPESMKQSVASMCRKTSECFIGDGQRGTDMNLSFHSLNFNL